MSTDDQKSSESEPFLHPRLGVAELRETWDGPLLRPAGTELNSMDTEPPVDNDTPVPSSESHTRDFHVELSLSSYLEDEPSRHELSIAGLTYKEGSGIFRQLSAYLLGIVGQDRSSGDSSND